MNCVSPPEARLNSVNDQAALRSKSSGSLLDLRPDRIAPGTDVRRALSVTSTRRAGSFTGSVRSSKLLMIGKNCRVCADAKREGHDCDDCDDGRRAKRPNREAQIPPRLLEELAAPKYARPLLSKCKGFSVSEGWAATSRRRTLEGARVAPRDHYRAGGHQNVARMPNRMTRPGENPSVFAYGIGTQHARGAVVGIPVDQVRCEIDEPAPVAREELRMVERVVEQRRELQPEMVLRDTSL